METIKRLGIYIDYENAFLMELINNMIVSRDIKFEVNEKTDLEDTGIQPKIIHKVEEDHLKMAYYVELGDIISNYHEVVLFGPNNVKNELFNLLKFDHNFETIKIKIGSNDVMNIDEMHAYVKEYYGIIL